MTKKLFTIILCLFFIIYLYDVAEANNINENKIFGKIKITDNKIIINNKEYELINDPLIIFKDKLGCELINFKQITNNIYGTCYLNDRKKINTIIISGRDKPNYKTNLEKIYVFKEPIYEYKIDYTGNFLAYYSWKEKQLKIIDLLNQKIIWKKKVENPKFQWHPNKTFLAYSNSNTNVYQINILDLNSFKEKILIKKQNKNIITFVYYFTWSPDGGKIAYILMEGFPDSHGNINNINIIEVNSGDITSFRIPDVNFITWSPTGKYLAFSQLLQSDILTSSIGILNLENNKLDRISAFNECHLNPIFNKDNKLIFCEINSINEKILLYDLLTKNKIIIKNEFKFLDNFCWLNKDNLVYTFGDLPQIKILNIKNKNARIINNGFLPFTVNNNLFFIINKTDKAYLYKIDLQAG